MSTLLAYEWGAPAITLVALLLLLVGLTHLPGVGGSSINLVAMKRPGYWLTADEARAVKEAQSYLRDEPDRHEASVERRSRPR